jgi:hypothetical protein
LTTLFLIHFQQIRTEEPYAPTALP